MFSRIRYCAYDDVPLVSYLEKLSSNQIDFLRPEINYSWEDRERIRNFSTRNQCYRSQLSQVANTWGECWGRVGGFPATVIHLQGHTRPLRQASYHAPSIPITTNHWTPSSYRDLCLATSHTYARSLYVPTSLRNTLARRLTVTDAVPWIANIIKHSMSPSATAPGAMPSTPHLCHLLRSPIWRYRQTCSPTN